MLAFGWFFVTAAGFVATNFGHCPKPSLSTSYLALSNPQSDDCNSAPDDKLQVVVVGGGVGGLATAARIASSSDVNVRLLEKNEHVGGRSGSFDVTVPNLGTFRHERGASLLLLPHIYNELFEDCSATAEEFGLTMRPCVPAYQVVFDDGDRLDVGFPEKVCASDASVNEQLMESKRKMDILEPNGSSKWNEYLTACAAFLDCGLPNFIEERLDLLSFPAFLKEALRDFGKVCCSLRCG